MSTSGNCSIYGSSSTGSTDSLLLFISTNCRAMIISSNYSHNNNSTSISIFKSKAGGIDVKAPISSAGFEIQWEGIQLHCWDSWLNSEKGKNKVVKKRLKQVPQQTAASMAHVQRTEDGRCLVCAMLHSVNDGFNVHLFYFVWAVGRA